MQVETHWQDVLESLQGIGVPCRLAMGIADILHEAGFTGPAEAQGAAVLPRKCPRPRSVFRANIDQEIENVMPQLWSDRPVSDCSGNPFVSMKLSVLVCGCFLTI
jgi:hypothetical protein